jgi:hypothetical protein
MNIMSNSDDDDGNSGGGNDDDDDDGDVISSWIIRERPEIMLNSTLSSVLAQNQATPVSKTPPPSAVEYRQAALLPGRIRNVVERLCPTTICWMFGIG